MRGHGKVTAHVGVQGAESVDTGTNKGIGMAWKRGQDAPPDFPYGGRDLEQTGLLEVKEKGEWDSAKVSGASSHLRTEDAQHPCPQVHLVTLMRPHASEYAEAQYTSVQHWDAEMR